MVQTILEVRNLFKVYAMPAGKFTALSGVSFGAAKGELIAITGESGSGKSTLLNLISGIDVPTTGDVMLNGSLINKLSEESRNQWRGKYVGIVFQFYQLIPTLTILENILLPMDFCNCIPKKERVGRAKHLLNEFEIFAQANKFPFEMSGGQQQRAAIARALANDPALIAADEPTGNLDSQTSEKVFVLFKALQAEGKTIIMVTHNSDLAAQCGRTIRIQDGKIITDSQNN
jgi:putative ABC transport system ATP-binding protein